MTLQRQVIFWVIAFAALILMLWLLSPILLPFLAGLVLAYFLDPIADAFERVGLSRLASSLIILIFAILGCALLLFLIVPALGDQIAKFANNLPSLVTDIIRIFNESAPQWVKDTLARSGTDVPSSVSDIAGRAAGWIATLLASIWSGGLALFNVISLLVITPIVAFYILLDWDRMVAKVDSWLPREHQETIRALARQIDNAMAGFVRGQGTVCLALGVFYAIGLSLAGLNFGLLIGLGAGFLSFIPYVGSIIGAIMAIGTGLVQFWPDWVSVLIVGGIFALGQFLEGNFLSPKLVGDRVGLHPVWLMFALFAFGYVFGFVGLLLAVPLAAAAGVLVRFALAQYLKSPLYLGFNRQQIANKPVERDLK
jgi:predicted PurR-regulated permease PerM